jgi:alkaline phosphatase D
VRVLPLEIGPIVGETTSTRVRLWGRAAYEATPEGPRRACGVARIRSSIGGGFSDPVFFKMNPNFDLTGVVVFDALEPGTEHEYEMGYFFSETEASDLDWSDASRSRFHTGTDDRGASRSFLMGSCRYLPRLFGGTWLDARGDRIFGSMLRQIEAEERSTDALLMLGDQIYADDLGFLFPDQLLDDYLERYREAFGQENIRRLMSRVPTYMILDDHEIEDGWPKNATPKDLRVRYPAAIHAYLTYQASHGPLFAVKGHGIDGVPEKIWYRFHDGCCDFFVMDVRTERLLGEDGGNLHILSETQMDALKSWLVDGSGRVKLVATSVPLFPEVRTKLKDHWSGFPLDRDDLLRFLVENECERVVLLSGDVHASTSAELRTVGGSRTKVVSIVSSPFFWPYPGGPSVLFRLEGTIRAGDLTFELAEAGPVQTADNFTRVTVHPDRVEVEVFSRKGLPLGPSKVHRF